MLVAMLSLNVEACAKLPVRQSSESAGPGNAFSGDPSQNPYNILAVEPRTHFDIVIERTRAAIMRGTETAMNHYSTGLPDGAIIVPKNAALSFNVTNNLRETTTVHWHGLKIPNDQDGPFNVLQPGGKAQFAFTLDEAGTNWYHPHTRPILPQLNSGLYAPFIVKEDYDSQYSGDYILTLDDWTLSPRGVIDDRYGSGHMEVFGNVETVNKKTGADIYPVALKKGEIVKLRFINASTAQWHTLSLPGHEFRVTHLDGNPLVEPYVRDSITIFAGQRVDVELKGIYDGGTFYIVNERDLGMRIPVVYVGAGIEMSSPFVPPESKAFPGIANKPVDFEYVLNTQMAWGGNRRGPGMMGGGMPMEWTINGLAFPDVAPTHLRVGEVYKLRFINLDRMMMSIPHPFHIHGGHFQILSIDGTPAPREMWLDTVEVYPGEYVDIAIKFDYPGTWMMHCHVIDHEDNGMLTMLMAE